MMVSAASIPDFMWFSRPVMMLSRTLMPSNSAMFWNVRAIPFLAIASEGQPTIPSPRTDGSDERALIVGLALGPRRRRRTEESLEELGGTETFLRWAAESARRIAGDIMPATLAVADGHLCFQTGSHVACLNAEDGKEMWRGDRPVARGIDGNHPRSNLVE